MKTQSDVSAEVISIGTEILLGELTDTNSVYLARTLRDLGINLFTMLSVGDNRQRIAEAVRASLGRAHIVITCGGLGPTVDDVTRQGVADATDRGLTFHQDLLDQIAARFNQFRVQMTENNRQQAYLPDDAVRVENPVGTAPAFIVEQGDRCVISLPGVPREMKYLMQEQIIPYLKRKYQLGIIKARILKTAGIGESSLDDMLGRHLLENNNPTIGLAAHMGQIDIRITAKAATMEAVDRMISQTEDAVRERAGRFIFGADDEQLEDVFVSLLQQNDSTIAIVQAGIPDVVIDSIRQVPGGQDYLQDVAIYAHPQELRDAYALSDDTPLRDVARIVAEQAALNTGADAMIIALSDPDVTEGADAEQTTVIGVYTSDKYRDRVYGFGAQSDFARAWGRSWLLSTAWRLLKEIDHAG
jgi:nicotinamide-nucleotide amidase